MDQDPFGTSVNNDPYGVDPMLLNWVDGPEPDENFFNVFDDFLHMAVDTQELAVDEPAVGPEDDAEKQYFDTMPISTKPVGGEDLDVVLPDQLQPLPDGDDAQQAQQATPVRRKRRRAPPAPPRDVFSYLTRDNINFPPYARALTWFQLKKLVRYGNIPVHPYGITARLHHHQRIEKEKGSDSTVDLRERVMSRFLRSVDLDAYTRGLLPDNQHSIPTFNFYDNTPTEQSVIYSTPAKRWQEFTPPQREHICGLLDVERFIVMPMSRSNSVTLHYSINGESGFDNYGYPFLYFDDVNEVPQFIRDENYALYAVPASLYLEPYQVSGRALKLSKTNALVAAIDLRYLVGSAINAVHANVQGGLNKIGEFRHFGVRFWEYTHDDKTIHYLTTGPQEHSRKQIALITGRLVALARLGVTTARIDLRRSRQNGYNAMKTAQMRAATIFTAIDANKTIEAWTKGWQAFKDVVTSEGEVFVQSMLILKTWLSGSTQEAQVSAQMAQILTTSAFQTTPTSQEYNELGDIVSKFLREDTEKTGVTAIKKRPVKNLRSLIELGHLPSNHPRNRNQAPFLGGLAFDRVDVKVEPETNSSTDDWLTFSFASGPNRPDADSVEADSLNKLAAILTMFGAYWEQSFDVYSAEMQLKRARQDIFGAGKRYANYVNGILKGERSNDLGLLLNAQHVAIPGLVQYNRVGVIDIDEKTDDEKPGAMVPLLINPNPNRADPNAQTRPGKTKKVKKASAKGTANRSTGRQFVGKMTNFSLPVNSKDRWFKNAISLRANDVVFDTVPIWDAVADEGRYQTLRLQDASRRNNTTYCYAPNAQQRTSALLSVQLLQMHRTVYAPTLSQTDLNFYIDMMKGEEEEEEEEEEESSGTLDVHALRRLGSRFIGSVGGMILAPYFNNASLTSQIKKNDESAIVLDTATGSIGNGSLLMTDKGLFGVYPITYDSMRPDRGTGAPSHLRLFMSRPDIEIPQLDISLRALEMELSDMHFAYTADKSVVAYCLGSNHIPSERSAEGRLESVHSIPVQNWLGELAVPPAKRPNPKRDLPTWGGSLRYGQTHLLADFMYLECKFRKYPRAQTAKNFVEYNTSDRNPNGAQLVFNPRYQLADLFVLRRAMMANALSPLPWVEAHRVATPSKPLDSSAPQQLRDIPEAPALAEWDIHHAIPRFYLGTLMSGNRRLPSSMTALSCDVFALAASLHVDNTYAGNSMNHVALNGKSALNHMIDAVDGLQLVNRAFDQSMTWSWGTENIWSPEGTNETYWGTPNLPAYHPINVYGRNFLSPNGFQGSSQFDVNGMLASMAEHHFFLNLPPTNTRDAGKQPDSAVYVRNTDETWSITLFGQALAEDLGSGMHMNRHWLAQRLVGSKGLVLGQAHVQPIPEMSSAALLGVSSTFPTFPSFRESLGTGDADPGAQPVDQPLPVAGGDDDPFSFPFIPSPAGDPFFEAHVRYTAPPAKRARETETDDQPEAKQARTDEGPNLDLFEPMSPSPFFTPGDSDPYYLDMEPTFALPAPSPSPPPTPLPQPTPLFTAPDPTPSYEFNMDFDELDIDLDINLGAWI